MSDTASATVVDIVGALTPKLASSLAGMGAGSRMPVEGDRSTKRGHMEGEVCEDMAMMGVVAGMWGSKLSSSGVLPLKEMKRMMSFCDGVSTDSSAEFGADDDVTHVSNVSQVSVSGFTCVHEARRDAQGLACRHEFLADVGGFADAGDNELAAFLLALSDSVDGRGETFFGGGVCLVEFGD